MKSRKPRILFIATFPPPIHGSAVVSLQIKSSEIINESFRCNWVNLGTSRRMDEIGKRTIAKPFRFIRAWLQTLWLLTTRHYSLCYLAITCHGNGFLKDAPFVILCKLFRRKIVIHQHNKGMANDVDRWPYRWLLPLCYKNAKVILLSRHLYQDIEKVVPKENVVICPNGIRVQEFKSLRVQDSPDTNHVPRLLFLSNLIESKGVLVLLDALKILKDKGYSFVCDFVGGETKEIDAQRFNEEVEKRGLNELAFYRGRKYGKDKEDAFEQSDVFVLPTYYENECFPLVLLEAMQHGLPCVTTDEGGIRDIVGKDSGFTVHGQNPEELAIGTAEALEELVKSAELRIRMGETGRKRVEELFTEVVFEKRIKDILWTSINS